MPAPARFTIRSRRVASMPRSRGDVPSCVSARIAGRSGVTGTRIRSDLLEDRAVQRAVRRVGVDDDEVDATSRDGDRAGHALGFQEIGGHRARRERQHLHAGRVNRGQLVEGLDRTALQSRRARHRRRSARLPCPARPGTWPVTVSASMSRTRCARFARTAARLVAIVVLPTPPLGLKTSGSGPAGPSSAWLRRRPGALGPHRRRRPPSGCTWPRHASGSTRRSTDG